MGAKIELIGYIIFFLGMGVILCIVGVEKSNTRERLEKELKLKYYTKGYRQACKDVDENKLKCEIFTCKGKKMYVLNQFKIEDIEAEE